MTMDLSRVDKKLREAEFFLRQMPDGIAGGNTETAELLDFYLSAVLGAARSVDYRLRHEQPVLYKGWRDNWDNLMPKEAALIKFFVDERNWEVHESGSHRDEKTDMIPMVSGQSYHDKHTGSFTVYGPAGGPLASLPKLVLCFTINGVERKATDACQEYLNVLKGMVAKFKSDHP